ACRHRRIVVIRATGSGKSTFAHRLARSLDVALVELDALFWGSDWTPAPPDVFRALADEATRAWGGFSRATTTTSAKSSGPAPRPSYGSTLRSLWSSGPRLFARPEHSHIEIIRFHGPRKPSVGSDPVAARGSPARPRLQTGQ